MSAAHACVRNSMSPRQNKNAALQAGPTCWRLAFADADSSAAEVPLKLPSTEESPAEPVACAATEEIGGVRAALRGEITDRSSDVAAAAVGDDDDALESGSSRATCRPGISMSAKHLAVGREGGEGGKGGWGEGGVRERDSPEVPA
jgi:hypothetical protein